MFGEETIPLAQLVAGQITELERLAEPIEISRENRALLLEVNSGIERTTGQINSIETLLERSQRASPQSVSSLAEVRQYVDDMKSTRANAEEVVTLKLLLVDQAIDESALQSDTAYKMGQEMVGLGNELSAESKTASPGRAGQIAASAASAQTLASGVELQTLAHIAELQAMSLELQRSLLERSWRPSRLQNALCFRTQK